MFTGKYNNNDNMSENNTTMSSGLWKWTADSVFRLISPSQKYKESNNNTNNNVKNSINNNNNSNVINDSTTMTDKINIEETTGRNRSISLDGLDPSFYKKYELLYNDDATTTNYDNISNSNSNNTSSKFPYFSSNGGLMSPVKLRNDKDLPTDTFLNKKYSLPSNYNNQSNKNNNDNDNNNNKLDDTDTSLLNKLFNKEMRKINNLNLNNIESNNLTKNSTIPIPGKFPKNKQKLKVNNINTTSSNGNCKPNSNFNSNDNDNDSNNNNNKDGLDYSSMNELSNELEINKKLLIQINEYVNDLLEENSKIKTDYNQIKLELIHEMKQCKIIVDKYLLLNDKYKQLKIMSNNIFKINNDLTNINKDQGIQIRDKQQRINQLEIQINKMNIRLDEKITQIDELRNEVALLRDQLNDERDYYHLEILKLQNSLNMIDSRNIINQNPTYI